MEVRPQVGVSSCLLGEEVRFNGGHKRYRFLTDELGPYVDWVPYCPEVSIGLGTPREPIRLTADGRLVNRSGTADHTAAMAALPRPAEGLDGYVFKAKSPSCGIRAIPRYGQDGLAARHDGRGLYADRVLTMFPLLAVEDEGRLNDAGLREAFCERIFATARLRSLFSGSWSAGDLVAFHARHKLQLLAHDPARYRAAGRVVAGAGPSSRSGLPGPVPGRDGQPGDSRPHRERAAARVQPDRPAAGPAAAAGPGGQDRGLPARRGAAERAGRAARALRERRGVRLAGGANLPQALSGGTEAAALRRGARFGGRGMKPLVRAT